ncbi:MAG: helix-turn-helix domain-containing protein [Actinomycetota bacterium]|nr:helix-turn-helix domain-containing protein [Actinomycetota bacterium]
MNAPNKLREKRHEKGLRLEDLSRLVGISTHAISRHERGITRVSPDQWRRYAWYYGTTEGELGATPFNTDTRKRADEKACGPEDMWGGGREWLLTR